MLTMFPDVEERVLLHEDGINLDGRIYRYRVSMAYEDVRPFLHEEAFVALLRGDPQVKRDGSASLRILNDLLGNAPHIPSLQVIYPANLSLSLPQNLL